MDIGRWRKILQCLGKIADPLLGPRLVKPGLGTQLGPSLAQQSPAEAAKNWVSYDFERAAKGQMWTESDIGLHQLQTTSDLYPNGESSRQVLKTAEMNSTLFFFFFKKRFYPFIFRERAREWVRGRGTSMCSCLSCAPPLGTWPTTQACALTGNQTGNSLVHRLVLNTLSYTSQGYFSTFK